MKWFLIFCFLLPLNLIGEEFRKSFGDWTTIVTIDDFTDKKDIHVYSRDDEKNAFSIIYKEPELYVYQILVDSIEEECLTEDTSFIDILFRVDKNEVLELPMRPKLYNRTEWIIDADEILKRNLRNRYILYQKEMAEGQILRIRIDNSEFDCSYSIDLAFDLDNFDKAIKPLYNEISDHLDFYTLTEYLNNND